MVAAKGVGEVRVRPDQVEITVGVSVRNTTLEDVRSDVDDTSAAIISQLNDQGVNSDDVQTSFISLQPVYTFEDVTGDSTPDYYLGEQDITFLLRNISNYNDVIQGLYNAGINTISGITFKVSNQTEYESEARSRAVQNAVDIATELVDALGVRLGRIYSITDETNTQPPGPYPVAESSSSGNGPSIAAGQIVITSTVNLSYFIVGQGDDD